MILLRAAAVPAPELVCADRAGQDTDLHLCRAPNVDQHDLAATVSQLHDLFATGTRDVGEGPRPSREQLLSFRAVVHLARGTRDAAPLSAAKAPARRAPGVKNTPNGSFNRSLRIHRARWIRSYIITRGLGAASRSRDAGVYLYVHPGAKADGLLWLHAASYRNPRVSRTRGGTQHGHQSIFSIVDSSCKMSAPTTGSASSCAPQVSE